MFKADDDVSVTLQAHQWNEVLVLLGRAKFNRVFHLIASIQKQCMAQGGLPMQSGNSHDQAEGAHVPH